MNDLVAPPPSTGLLPDAETFRRRLQERRRLPINTYRFQLHQGFSFRDAAAVVPYLAQLGITDCYCSPYLAARPGSTHGYDITDHNVLNSELGTEADFVAFTDVLAKHQIGQVLDFVPNHMGADPVVNQWWRDVLEDGPSSPHARFFDIDWDPIKPALKGKVLLPILGDHYGLVLERGELRLDFADGAFIVRYFQTHLPIDPGRLPPVLRQGLDALRAELGEEDRDLLEYLSIITALEHLPPAQKTKPELVAERQREKKVTRERLARLVAGSPRIRQHLDAILAAYNGQSGDRASFDRLHELLEAQPYRVAYWKTALHEINYRRFFEINELAGLRMEDPAVFVATHPLVLRLIREGKITGLRLDHLDGLFDPGGYVERLQEAVLQEWLANLAPDNPPSEEWQRAVRQWRQAERRADPGGVADRPFWVVAEKILSPGEVLPDSWPLYGTSGYDFLNDLNRLFVDATNSKRLKKVYGRFTGLTGPITSIIYECKLLITWTSMASELNMLAVALNRISEADRRLRDFTLASLTEALREVVAAFPVYRTYVSAVGASDADRRIIELALRIAHRRNPAMEPSVFRFLRSVLLPAPGEKEPNGDFQRRLQFAMEFQQYTGPVQAKGVEDTAFYRYNVLLSLNEVGGDPAQLAGSTAPFHEANRYRRDHWPCGMLTTATHDTKRGEDVRARLNVLSEMVDDWRRLVSRWARHNASHRTEVDGEPAPDRNDEYLFYQALVGAWPNGSAPNEVPEDLVPRLREYMNKATKEAKVHTSWINPNEDYDKAVARFVDRTLTGPRVGKFLAMFLPFQRRVAQLGMLNSLAQVVMKMVSPGVVDTYQGTELWDLSLVDPDNRRPVDYAHRCRALEEMAPLLDSPPDQSAVSQLLESWEDGRVKLFVTAGGLRLRRRFPELLREGEYLALEVEGEQSNHVVGVARRDDRQWILAVVPRLVGGLLPHEGQLPIGMEPWQTTRVVLPPELSGRAFRNIFTGERIAVNGPTLQVADILRIFPVAILTLDEPRP